ncbi:MAG: hypothetical protein ACHQ53_07625 [Polyangiales bacterium]
MADDLEMFQTRVRAVRELLDDFKLERIAYLVVAVAMIAVQIGIFLVFWNKGQAGWPEFAIMMGPGGMILVTAGRILRMWSDALRYLQPAGGAAASAGEPAE